MSNQDVMTERERAQWDALYAAAFVAEFSQFWAARTFNTAKEIVGAGRAREVADLGIQKLRELKRALPGQRVGDVLG